MRFNNQGISLLKLLIFVAIFGLFIGGGFVLLNNERAKTRDAQRLADMARVQAAFEFLFNDNASYSPAAINGCDSTGQLVSQCNLAQYLPQIAQIKDPGRFTYTISQVPSDQGFGITFSLEKGYQSIKAGQHILTHSGIK